jgi:hypothetical protein
MNMHHIHKPSALPNIATYCLFFIFLVTATVYTFKKPQYNWDMLAYMATAITIDNPSPAAVHKIVYTTAAREVPGEQYRLLVDTTHAFKGKAYQDPVFFHQSLPFYVVKPLYIGLVYAFYKAGVPLVKATLLPSTLSFFLTGMLFFCWTRKYASPLLAFLISVIGIAMAPLINLAELSTPDCLSAFLIFYTAFLLFERRKILLPFIVILLSVCARIDNIIFCFFILTLSTFSTKTAMSISIKQYAAMVALLALAYLAISYLPHIYGWNRLFISSFYSESVSVYRNKFTLRAYLSARHSAVMVAMLVYHLFVYLLMAALVFMDVKRPLKWQKLSFDQQFILVLLLTMFVRLLLHPEMGDRFYMGFYLVITMLLIRAISGLVHDKEQFRSR